MFKKNYSPTGRSCRVTFELPHYLQATTAHLCGEFNEWSTSSHPLKHRKDGGFSLQVSLEAGRPYRFRYLLDSERWENDDAADAYEPNPLGSDNSVIRT